MNKIYEIIPHVQHYFWGSMSHVAYAHLLAPDKAKKNRNQKPFAELWYGAHPDGPSEICNNELSNSEPDNLYELFKLKNQDQVQDSDLNFLFKILSIEKILSIQMHPDRDNAIRLHKIDPINYPDSNHKPEMGVALTKVELLYGFRPWREVKNDLRKFSFFDDLLTTLEIDLERNFKDYQELTRRIFSLNSERLKIICDNLYKIAEDDTGAIKHLVLISKLKDDYQDGDPGLLLLLFMNYVTLLPGEAIFMHSNLIHAYISGDVAECMANSNNVVRAGLTPKFKDSKTLIDFADFAPKAAQVLNPAIVKSSISERSYPKLTDEFAVKEIFGTGDFLIRPEDSVSLIVLISGKLEYENKTLSIGKALFIDQLTKPLLIKLEEARVFCVC